MSKNIIIVIVVVEARVQVTLDGDETELVTTSKQEVVENDIFHTLICCRQSYNDTQRSNDSEVYVNPLRAKELTIKVNS